MVGDREERDDETNAKSAMQVIEVRHPMLLLKCAGLKKVTNQYSTTTYVVDDNGLMVVIETTAAMIASHF
ncbi:MAG: hypothetical protein LM517_08430 [Nitrosomonas sp.]|nr:hypothetical protein [Nitrosomonas sp.]